MSCKDCHHFKPRDEEADSGGSCRRYPPQMVFLIEEEQTVSAFPLVDATHWCGEFKPQFGGH